MNKKDIVIQHNDLISGRHNWSANEIKIVINAISKLNKEKDLKIEMKKKDIETLLDEKSNTQNLKDIVKKLSTKIFEIQENGSNWRILTWFSEINYKDGVFTIWFNERMESYLLDLKENFTRYNIQNILPMKSNYSMRIYQLLKQYQRIGSRTFKVEDLRNILKIPESYNYNKIKKLVILKAQEEMKDYSDIIFDFEEIKTSRKITDIKFIIKIKEEVIVDIQDIDNPWHYSEYFGKDIEIGGIEYKSIEDIIIKDDTLMITFESGEKIRVKDEETLIQSLL